ncbi:MAG: antibiotic biosynthesis monooxygenase [Kutzneria sp.]|nr:antibiotic biosynthesis monooxygenase [Kutzneria sp.]MBV9844159.1 antibiotic biosynthesis monooxygenase [Kutzneria sp.]
MIVVVAEILIHTGRQELFVAACRRNFEYVLKVPGCRSLRLVRGITDPACFRIVAEWENLESLTEGFFRSEEFARWREDVSDYYVDLPVVEWTVCVE